jgi:hypothetical protein
MFKTVEPRFGGSNIIGGANEIRLVALTGSEPAVSAARGRLFRLRAVEAERWDCSCCVRVVRGGGAARRGAPVATQQADDEIHQQHRLWEHQRHLLVVLCLQKGTVAAEKRATEAAS